MLFTIVLCFIFGHRGTIPRTTAEELRVLLQLPVVSHTERSSVLFYPSFYRMHRLLLPWLLQQMSASGAWIRRFKPSALAYKGSSLACGSRLSTMYRRPAIPGTSNWSWSPILAQLQMLFFVSDTTRLTSGILTLVYYDDVLVAGSTAAAVAHSTILHTYGRKACISTAKLAFPP